MPRPDPPRFDKTRLRSSFEKAAAGYDEAAVLQREVADRLLERLDIIRLNPFRILDLGTGTGYSMGHLGRRYRKAELVGLDLAHGMVRQARRRAPRLFSRQRFICGDAENLPLARQSVDLVYSNLTLQWSTDLVQVAREIFRVLKPGGLVLFSTFGPDTLTELREAWGNVDRETHVNPFADMHDVGDVLFSSGFTDVVMDVDRLRETFTSVFALMTNLKQLGAHNINPGRPHHLTGKGRMTRLVDCYETYRTEQGLPASYEVVYAHAWAPPEPGAIAVPLRTTRPVTRP